DGAGQGKGGGGRSRNRRAVLSSVRFSRGVLPSGAPHRADRQHRELATEPAGGHSRAAMEAQQPPPTLLSVRDLAVRFRTEEGAVHAVNRGSFDLGAGETVAVVGESGCGKSATSLALMGLLPRPSAHVSAGKIVFRGEDLLALPERRMRALRGKDISVVFQDPMTSLNPVLTIRRQMTEAIEAHVSDNERQATARALALLKMV